MNTEQRDTAIRNGFEKLFQPSLGRTDAVASTHLMWDNDDETCYVNGFRCELPSDDDGFFHFHPWDPAINDYSLDVTVLIPYPEA